MSVLSGFEERLEAIADRHPGVPARGVKLAKFVLFAHRLIDARLARTFAANGLSHSAWGLLMMIYSSPTRAISPSCASETLNQSRAHMTRLTDELVAAGWVERVAQTGDRRSIDVRLTETGEARLRAAMPAVGADHERLMSCFAPEESAELESLLRRWIVHLEHEFDLPAEAHS